MNNYKQERDEASQETSLNCDLDDWSFKNGADWANSRAEKVIMEDEKVIKGLLDTCNALQIIIDSKNQDILEMKNDNHDTCLIRSLELKITDRDSMIEKLRKKVEISHDAFVNHHAINWNQFEEMLTELEEWKKTNE